MANMRTFGEADVAPRAGMRGEVGEPGFQLSATDMTRSMMKKEERENEKK